MCLKREVWSVVFKEGGLDSGAQRGGLECLVITLCCSSCIKRSKIIM